MNERFTASNILCTTTTLTTFFLYLTKVIHNELSGYEWCCRIKITAFSSLKHSHGDSLYTKCESVCVRMCVCVWQTWKSVESKLRHHYFKTWIPHHIWWWTEQRNTAYRQFVVPRLFLQKKILILTWNISRLLSQRCYNTRVV